MVRLHDQGDELGQIEWSALGWSPALPVAGPTSLPAAGQLAFVVAPGESKPWHVVAMGGDEAMSLWKTAPSAARVKLSYYFEDRGHTVFYCDLPPC